MTRSRPSYPPKFKEEAVRLVHASDEKRDLSTDEAIDKGLTKAVKDFDSRFPPEWRLSRKGRAAEQ